MSEDSEWWDYWKKRMMENEILDLREELACLQRSAEENGSEDSIEDEELEDAETVSRQEFEKDSMLPDEAEVLADMLAEEEVESSPQGPTQEGVEQEDEA
jgi:hypothetical protein